MAPRGAGSGSVSPVTFAKTSAVRVESGSRVVKAVAAPGSVEPTEIRSWPGMSMVPTRKAAVSRTAVTLKVVVRPETVSEASISTPGRPSKTRV